MAKRNLIWHIGPEDLASVLLPRLLEADPASDFHRVTAAEAQDADLDLRRAHKAAGRSRQDVDGAWSMLECKVWHQKGTWLLSTPSAHLADEEQRRMAWDGLRGVKVQIVLVRTPDNAAAVHDLADRWRQALHPERLHVIDTDGSVGAAWRGLFEVAGLPARELPEAVDIIAPGTAAAGVLGEVISQHAGRADVAATAAGLLAGGGDEDERAAVARALAGAAVELVSAEQRIRELLADNERLDRKRRKHKRRLTALRNRLADPSPAELEHVTV